MPSGARFTFGDFELDAQTRRLTRRGEPAALADRHLEVLHQLVARAGDLVSKDALVAAAWGDVAVTDNSLEQAISALRRVLGVDPDGRQLIETVPRRGYRFIAPVARSAPRQSDASLDALLAPHRAWLEGRAALETLERAQIDRARTVFEQVLDAIPDHPQGHIGLANACAMQFESTRADERPDLASLASAVEHAREGCRLEPQSGEAWATLGFVLDRAGQSMDAFAALRRAVSLEPDNWRHHLRLAYVSWGEERLRATRRTLALLPGCPLAHWLAATVHVARNVLDEAERQLSAGIDVQQRQGQGRFSAVGLHWLRGLVHLARDDDEKAMTDLERELSFESSGQLYARECCANTWYAIGAVHLRHRRADDARGAFEEACRRVAHLPLAAAAAAALGAGDRSVLENGRALSDGTSNDPPRVERVLAHAMVTAVRGDHAAAAHLAEQALAAAPPGNVGWLLPVEPLLRVTGRHEWVPALERLRVRAA